MTQHSVPRVRLGRTGLQVARLSLGAWGLANPGAAPAAQVNDEEEILEILDTAFRAGINVIDSAEAYANEATLARLAGQLDSRPDDLIVSTKFGHGKGFAASQIRASVEQSLTDWGLPAIPLFMLHDPRDDADMATILAPGGALAELRKLQDEGLVGHVGVATGTLRPLLAAVETDEFDVVQFPRLYTLLNRAAKASGLLEKARAKDIGTVLTSPFAGNVLGTGVRGVDAPLYSFWPAQPEVVEAVRRMQDRADERGVPLPAAALAFALVEPAIDMIVFGVDTAAQLEQDIAAATREPAPADVAAIVAEGTVDEHWIGGPDFVWPFPDERMPADLRARLAAAKS